MRRVKRSEEFEINLNITKETFINPPRDLQRSSVINRAVKEFTADLYAIDELAKNFVSGDPINKEMVDRTQMDLSDQEIMEDWQIPLMQRMADVTCETQGDILEVGFGRGVSSDMIQAYNVASHTIIECNDLIIENYFSKWKENYSNRKITMVKGLWQDVIDEVGLYDGIFFHTYPLNMNEYMEYVNESITFAAHFFSYAAAHLKPGGAFTYFSNEIDSVSREHQRQLLKHFSKFEIQTVALDVPHDVKDTWWADSMVVVKAIK